MKENKQSQDKKNQHLNCSHHNHEVHQHLQEQNKLKSNDNFLSISRTPDSIFKIGIGLNLFFVMIELYSGYAVNSLALLSDAFHNLTDVFGLLVGWYGFYLSQKKKSKKYSLYTAFINSSLLVVGSVWVIIEAFERLQNPQAPLATVMIFVSLIGFVINFVTGKLFHHDHHHDLNMKSAYLHLMGDAAISLGVTLAGVLIYFFAINWVDPVFSIIISGVIIFSSYKIIRESFLAIKNKNY